MPQNRVLDYIRTIQELLGHRNLEITMINTYLVGKSVLGIRITLDRH